VIPAQLLVSETFLDGKGADGDNKLFCSGIIPITSMQYWVSTSRKELSLRAHTKE
jgi:hypothetical protein